jgi:error-prone DNA polymerase
VELRCRSAFSFLEAASNPEDLVDCAAGLDYPALALGDVGGVYGIPRFHQAARRAGLRAIVGAQIFVADSNAEGLAARKPTSLLLLVETQRGYRNLCRILTESHRHVAKAESLNRWEEIEEHAAGLTALVRGDASLEAAGLDRAKAIFGGEQLWVDISRHMDRATEAAGRRASALADSARVRVVATGDVRHARPEGRRLFDALTCLREKTSLDQAGRRLAINAERHLRAPDEMAKRFADQPAWISATRAIAERCEFSLENLGYRFPRYPVPRGETQASYLRHLTFHGGHSRYGSPIPPRARAQLEHELALIEKLGLPGYFLIVHDIVQFAKNQKILAQGRGSAANSAVCYSLGITAVDPVGMDLLFERFLSEQRSEWPDIDLDLPSGAPREKVIQYVFDKYGSHGAAMTAVVITYRTRMAVREMGKVLGIEPNTVDRLSKTIARLEHRENLDELTSFLQQAGVDPRAPRIAGLLDLVERVRGLPRHLGQHTGGVVISGSPLDEIVPIEPASMPDRRVIQWDKEDCADLGIIKIDLLGLGMLAAIEDTLELIREHENVVVDLAHLPADDPDTYAMIQRADTIGTFQIESRAQMATLPRMKPETFYDLVVEVAIIRPGPIAGQMVNPYLNRRAGREAVTYPHPSLKPILKRTLGVPLFQEQLLRIAMVAAGFSGGEAEELRRAMGFKRSAKRMERLEARLRQGMTQRDIVGENQESIIRGIHSFALYGFPESHAASFALIAYASAFLKNKYPAAFLAGLLNAYPMGFYTPATLVKDAQRHGVEVRPIDVTHSHWRCTLETPNRKGDPPPLRLGLRYVNGLRREAGLAIEAERATASFTSVADFAKRVPLRRSELDTLAELGALTHLDQSTRTRRSALWQIAALERDPNSLFAGITPANTESPLPEMSPIQETLADYQHSGITTGPQILAHLRSTLRARGILASDELKSVPSGRLVRTAGQVIVRQRPRSAKGFVFLTLEDETGTSNAILTPRQFRRFRTPLHSASIIQIVGPIQNQDGVIHVRVQHLEALARCEELPEGHDYR